MYRLIGGQAVQHSDGFVFGSNDRYSLKYSDENCLVTVSIDDGMFTTTMMPLTARRWTADMGPLQMSDDEIKVVIDRIVGGWDLFSSTRLDIDYTPISIGAEPPKHLYWPLFGGERRPIHIPQPRRR